jgi:hypothetical protein
VNAANAAPSNSNLTIQQMLTAFPQYSGLQDGWGGAFVENYSYEALQATVSQRTAHGLSFNFNFTFSKNIGDDGNFRSGWNIPASAIDGHSTPGSRTVSIAPGRRLRRPTSSIPTPFTNFPSARGRSAVTLAGTELAGGWALSGVYSYSSGAPFGVTWSSGGNCANGYTTLNAYTCMPSLTPAIRQVRINGKFGSGPNGYVFSNASNIKYLDINAFSQPANLSTAINPSTGKYIASQYLIGNAPRTAAYGIRNPGNQTDNLSIRRSFPIFMKGWRSSSRGIARTS